MGERVNGIHEVEGSIPFGSTILRFRSSWIEERRMPSAAQRSDWAEEGTPEASNGKPHFPPDFFRGRPSVLRMVG